MTFTESISVCLRQKFATFSGRASRSEYWWFMLFITLAAVILVIPGFVLTVMSENQQPGTLGWVFFGLAGLFYLAMLIPLLAVTWRRLHDRNLSGWWYVGSIVAGLIPIVGSIAGIAIFVITVLKGTEGPNKFGDDPLALGKAHVFE